MIPKSPNNISAINLSEEVAAIREHEKIVITNALDEKFGESQPRNHPALFIDATVPIGDFSYSVCYAVQRRLVKPNHLFFPIVHHAIKEKVKTPLWFLRTGAQIIAYYNYQTNCVWVLRTQALRELDLVVSKDIKEYIPHANNKVLGYLIPYHDIDLTDPVLVEVSNEKHQLGIALAQSLYF